MLLQLLLKIYCNETMELLRYNCKCNQKDNFLNFNEVTFCFYANISFSFAFSVTLPRILFIILTHSAGFSVLSCWVTFSLSSYSFTSRRKMDCDSCSIPAIDKGRVLRSKGPVRQESANVLCADLRITGYTREVPR